MHLLRPFSIEVMNRGLVVANSRNRLTRYLTGKRCIYFIFSRLIKYILSSPFFQWGNKSLTKLSNLTTSYWLVLEPDQESPDSAPLTMQYTRNKMLHKQAVKYSFFKSAPVSLRASRMLTGWRYLPRKPDCYQIFIPGTHLCAGERRNGLYSVVTWPPHGQAHTHTVTEIECTCDSL